jgi:hypothetical protein
MQSYDIIDLLIKRGAYIIWEDGVCNEFNILSESFSNDEKYLVYTFII